MEVSYGPHPLQKLKLFSHAPQNKHTLLLIHGGAWNDVNNTYDDFKSIVAYLEKEKSMDGINIVGINYRLSPEVTHPFHFLDIVLGIQYLYEKLRLRKLSVAGHSVGATMALQLLNYKQILASGRAELKSGVAENIVEIPNLAISLGVLFFIDGIYHIPHLVAEYGAPYQQFVDRAFVSETQYAGAVQPSWADFRNFELAFEKLVVIQSRQDELLSLRQTRVFLSFLRDVAVEYTYVEEDWGAHEEVYLRREVAQQIGKEMGERA